MPSLEGVHAAPGDGPNRRSASAKPFSASVPRLALELREECGLGVEDGCPVVVEIRDGRPEITEITVKAKRNGRGIRSADMTLFNLDTLITHVMAELGRVLRPNPHNPDESIADWPSSDREWWAANRDMHAARTTRRGRPTREELEEVARVYREHVHGAPRAAVAALGYSERTAARRVQ